MTTETLELPADKLRRYASAMDWIDDEFMNSFRTAEHIIKAFEMMERITDLELLLIDECAWVYRDYASADAAGKELENGAEMYKVGQFISHCLKSEFFNE